MIHITMDLESYFDASGKIFQYESQEDATTALEATNMRWTFNFPHFFRCSAIGVFDIDTCSFMFILIVLSGSNVHSQYGREKQDFGLLPVDLSFLPMSIAAGFGHSSAICQVPSSDVIGRSRRLLLMS